MRKAVTALLALALLASLTSCGSAGDETNNPESLKSELAEGWNTWDTNSVLTHVLLPEGLAIRLRLKDGNSGEILENALIGRSGFDSKEHVVAGLHANDGSYTELTVKWRDINVRVQSASFDRELYLLVTPMATSPDDALIISTEALWGRTGTADLTITSALGTTRSDHATSPLTSSVGISTDEKVSVEEIANLVTDAREILVNERARFSDSSDLFDAMQTVLAWNVIYEPTNDRVITPVSRNWNVGWGGWILFEWDTYFAAYMHSVNNKELAYANAIAMTSEITNRGFVPNFASSRNTSEDRSEPPVGALVVREIYRKYQEEWFVEEVFDELLTWNRWWAENRDIDGYLVWGSDPYEREELPEWLEKPIGEKQGAKWESGLDNSPMFDDATHNSDTHRLMQADVGLMSLYILDCKSLSDLAGVLGKHDIRAELQQRARVYSEKLTLLWDDEFGLYLNKDLVTGDFSYRLSPTLFYPLLAKVPNRHQAKRMIAEHFNNPDEFYGEYMIPSIARNDAAFADNTYWRGRIWAPMNFLVYLGLRNYDLADARKDFVEKSSKLLLQSWDTERHVYENYNSETGQGDDAGMSDKFYQWGALLGFIGLIEEGYVASPEEPLIEDE